MAKIEFNGVNYDEFDVYKRRMLVEGVQPTDFTNRETGKNYNYLTVTVLETNRKDGALGKGSANYRFGTSADIARFNEFEFPLLVEATMVNGTDKGGETLGMILDIDFATAQEMELTPKKQKSAPVASATPAPSANAKA